MLPQEVREMSSDKLILLTEGTRPIMGKKIRYFKDAAMKKRVGQGETEVPRLDLEPKYSPTLEDVAGVDPVGEFNPTNFGFKSYKKGTKPADYNLK